MNSNRQDEKRLMDSKFSRYRSLLYFIACRVLEDGEEAEEAVQNCLLKASSQVSKFKSDGEFRSWVLRILIDEALVIQHQKGEQLQPEAYSAGR